MYHADSDSIRLRKAEYCKRSGGKGQQYPNFEKVGDLPESLPANDEHIDTDYGDLILYLGHRFVIYYDKNSWDFTKLGHIDNITQDELKDILGESDVTVTLSLK